MTKQAMNKTKKTKQGKTKQTATNHPAVSPPAGSGAVMKKKTNSKPLLYTQPWYIHVRVGSEIVVGLMLCDLDEVMASVKEKYFIPIINRFSKHN